MQKSQTENSILKDHKRKGKKLIPPMISQLGPMKEISWTRNALPEILWTALLNNTYGYKNGARLSLSFIETITQIHEGTNWFVSMSSFSLLSDEDKREVVLNLKEKDELEILCRTFLSLVYFYPECPLRFLFEDIDIQIDKRKALEGLKRLMHQMHDKSSIPATFAQANILYIGGRLGKLHLARGMKLARLPEIQDYPDSEISRELASLVRATISSIFGREVEQEYHSWPEYFWNRGLKIDICEF